MIPATPVAVNTPVRPGISEATLTAAGVRRITSVEAQQLIGNPEEGILIPYLTAERTPLMVNGREFFRVRSDNPNARSKYLSPVGSGCQVYFPPNFPLPLGESKTLYIVEGEFKALSLCEAGIPAVAVGGITSTCPNNAAGEPEVLPALAQFLRDQAIREVVFIGDNDTVFIPAFAKEMVKLAKCLSVPLRLLRIPVNALGKAPDDLVAELGEGFSNVWQQLQENLESVAGSESAGSLAGRLLAREADSIVQCEGAQKQKYLDGLIKLAAGFTTDVLTFANIAEVALKLGVQKTTFAKAVKNKVSHDQEDRLAERIEEMVQNPDADLKLFFDGDCYYRNQDGVWCDMIREDARLHLSMEGFSKAASGGASSEVDQTLYELQQHNRVDYAGTLCGRPAGYLLENGHRILVTHPPTIIEGKQGEWPTIRKVLHGLLGVKPSHIEGEKQLALFKGWLKLARVALRKTTEHLPGQVLALIGPPDCGKSLIIEHLLRPSLGGRSADANAYLLDKTQFNGDLWGSELLVISDKGLGDSARDRVILRDNLKKTVAEPSQNMRCLYKEQMTLRPIWRIVLAANDSAENITDLPSLDASFSDKIIYLKCFMPEAPLFCAPVQGAREGFTKALAEELPAFLHDVDSYEIPDEIVKGRFGITEWHHPHILDSLESASHLQPIIELILDWADKKFDSDERSRMLSAVELYQALAEYHDKMPPHVCSGVPHLGRQLASISESPNWSWLVTKGERRVGGSGRNQRQTTWTITKAEGVEAKLIRKPGLFSNLTT